MTSQTVTAAIVAAFQHVYPHTNFSILLNEDETIDVIPVHETADIDLPRYRAEIDSDDDGFLYFYCYDEDFAEENPDHDNTTDPVCVRVRL